MEVYRGTAALSDFRLKKLLTRLKAIDPHITEIAAEFVHFAEMSGKLTAKSSSLLKQLIDYGTPHVSTEKGTLYLVVPRPGTISPWSTKATDIINNSGLKAIKRIERGIAFYIVGAQKSDQEVIATLLHDRMTETVLGNMSDAQNLFEATQPAPFEVVNILKDGKQALAVANKNMGLALTDDEMIYLIEAYKTMRRNPTDVELMMFAQLNSEHCRHKIFNADWIIDGAKQPKSLFKMIQNTNEKSGQNVLSAYVDNGAVVRGPVIDRFFSGADKTRQYQYHKEPAHLVIKVETHNHPTAIAPVPGAATGTGGEIRDEAATGRGAKSKMGLAGYSVSNLEIPGSLQAWEKPYGRPERISSALNIMLEAPIGAASFANEFGRPGLSGYFRTYEQKAGAQVWGYHKPIMIAGGLGNIREEHVHKQRLPVGSLVIALGGPAMLIGLGGGAASSMHSGASKQSLDFASVQRGNGEMERRDQEVIDSCWALGTRNPIKAIHDVGAGGWSVSLTELVHDSGRGALFELRDLPNDEPGLSPLQIWCNEAQERYVLGIAPDELDRFTAICNRERCPFSVVGKLTKTEQLIVYDRLFKNQPINVPMNVLLGRSPKMTRTFKRTKSKRTRLNLDDITIADAMKRVLHLPAVGSKKFLITIGDRTVSGLVVRDQMVGPWQVPVADVAVTSSSYNSKTGEAMAMGERTPLALIDAAAAARVAVGEAITNIAAADIHKLSDVTLSANWMAAAGFEHEDQSLFDAVYTVGEEFCPALGLSIPVGKDSMSMRSSWQDGKAFKSVTAPISVIMSAFAPAQDVRNTLTPELEVQNDSVLLLIDLGQSKNRLGGSALAQVYNQVGDTVPDIDAGLLKKFFKTIQKLRKSSHILAYHDRSDGGLVAAVCEMAFASRSGLKIDVSSVPGSSLEKLFNEELGAIIQVKKSNEAGVIKSLQKAIGPFIYDIGHPTRTQDIIIKDGSMSYRNSRTQLEAWWSETSYQLQKMRDNPVCADQEFKAIADNKDPGLHALVAFQPSLKRSFHKPKVAIMREEGVNGQVEMAAAFDRAGFTSVDVHLNDLMDGSCKLADFKGIVACGGFSYGDVLGAGEGWAKSILFNPALRKSFSAFFERDDSFSLGVCNGCQMFAALKELIPGTEHWPTAFVKNKSEQFEGRLVLTKINETASLFFKGMAGSILPIPVAHGEGQAYFKSRQHMVKAQSQKLVVAQFVDNYDEATEKYPFNPNGSPQGITALTTPNGRTTIIMPHPERVFLSQQLSWHPHSWNDNSPWFQIFANARNWVR